MAYVRATRYNIGFENVKRRKMILHLSIDISYRYYAANYCLHSVFCEYKECKMMWEIYGEVL